MNIINTVFKTVILKVHNPSAVKRRIMDTAIERYTEALQYMLDFAESRKPEIEKICNLNRGYRAQIGKILSKDLMKDLNRFKVQPFKDSLKIEFTNLIENYILRKKKDNKATFPKVFIDDETLIKIIEEKSVNKKTARRLLSKLWSAKAVYFCRYSNTRDFCLLYNPDKKRYYAKLYLLNQHDELKHQPTRRSTSELRVVGKDTSLSESNRPERYIIVALSFGKYQEKYLSMALNNPCMIRTARLVKKNSDYFLMVNIGLEPENRVETESYAGFHILQDGRMSYTLCDLEGQILNHGFFSCEPKKDKTFAAKQKGNMIMKPPYWENIHILANRIVEICLKYNAQAVFESYPLYNYITEVLNYKLPLKGLPKPVRVSSFGLYQTCPHCGYNCKKNRSLDKLFLCTACGFGLEIDYLPSFNLARRILKYRSDKVHFICHQSDNGKSFIIKNKLLNIEFRGSSDNIDSFFDHIKVKTDEIRDYLKNQLPDWSKSDKKLFSHWNKLLTTDDIRKVIKIELS